MPNETRLRTPTAIGRGSSRRWAALLPPLPPLNPPTACDLSPSDTDVRGRRWLQARRLRRSHSPRCRKQPPSCSSCRPVRSPVSYTHLRAHETDSYLVCRLLLEKK